MQGMATAACGRWVDGAGRLPSLPFLRPDDPRWRTGVRNRFWEVRPRLTSLLCVAASAGQADRRGTFSLSVRYAASLYIYVPRPRPALFLHSCRRQIDPSFYIAGNGAGGGVCVPPSASPRLLRTAGTWPGRLRRPFGLTSWREPAGMNMQAMVIRLSSEAVYRKPSLGQVEPPTSSLLGRSSGDQPSFRRCLTLSIPQSPLERGLGHLSLGRQPSLRYPRPARAFTRRRRRRRQEAQKSLLGGPGLES